MRSVVIVTPDIVGPVKNGGVGTACYHYARTLARAGYDVSVLFTGVDLTEAQITRWRDWYANLTIHFYTMADVPKLSAHTYGFRWYHERSWRIMQWLRFRAPGYVLFQDWQGNGFWSVRAKQMGYAFADTFLGVIAHSSTLWQNEGMKTFGSDAINQDDLFWVESETVAGADVLISPSAHMIDWLRAHDVRLPPRVEICPYTFEDEPAEGRLDSIDRDHLIFFGRLETRKGIQLFANALRMLKEDGEALPRKVTLLGKLATINGKPSRTYIEQLEADLPEIEWRIETAFDYKDAVAYIREANGIVCIPSLLDNLPLTVIESINNGFAFLAAETGGIPELADARALFPATVAGMADAMRRRTQIDFGALNHIYSKERARDRWLSHMRSISGASIKPPRAPRPVPPISVCIPFYRHDRYVHRLVGAFLRMEIPNLQLVIVDDGTPKEERRALDSIRADLEAVGHVVHSQENAGPGAARNKAISLAKHDLILFFDADNIPFPNMIRELWKAMEASDAHSIAAPFSAVPPMNHQPSPSDVLYHFHPPGGSMALSLFDNMLGDMTALIRRSALDDVRGFNTCIDEPAWEDWELFFRLVGRGYKHFVYPVPLLYYTDHPDRTKDPAKLYDMRVSLISQLDMLDRSTLLHISKALAAQCLTLRDQGKWL